VVNTNGSGDDKFSVAFEPIDNGQRLRVIRRIYAKELNEPVVIRSVYNKISEVAQWGIYGESEVTPSGRPAVASASSKSEPVRAGSNGLGNLRTALERWVAATNARDIRNYISFYMPRLKAFYLARDIPRDVVRSERARAFESADLIEVHVVAPEMIFVDEGHIAIMRFRKQYTTKRGAQAHRGEVIQELRWRRTTQGWKIFSERDVKVVR
jgi:ketosteroid isomerase-like protein